MSLFLFFHLRRKCKQARKCSAAPLLLQGVIHDFAILVDLDLTFVRRHRLAFEHVALAHGDGGKLAHLLRAVSAYHRDVYCLVYRWLAARALGIVQHIASRSNRRGIAVAFACGDVVHVLRFAAVASGHILRILSCVQLADISLIWRLFYYCFCRL